MLGETHKRIAGKIAEELKLGEREAGLLEAGSVDPDSWEDFPHHKEKEYDIVRNIVRSRILFLEDDDECYHRLGVALHYIQDRWTLRPRLKDKHTSWEMSIQSAGFLDEYLETYIEKKMLTIPTKAVKAYVSFLSEIRKGIEGVAEEKFKFGRTYYGLCGKVIKFALLDRPTTWSTPILDLNLAYMISKEVSRLVLVQKQADPYWYSIKGIFHGKDFI